MMQLQIKVSATRLILKFSMLLALTFLFQTSFSQCIEYTDRDSFRVPYQSPTSCDALTGDCYVDAQVWWKHNWINVSEPTIKACKDDALATFDLHRGEAECKQYGIKSWPIGYPGGPLKGIHQPPDSTNFANSASEGCMVYAFWGAGPSPVWQNVPISESFRGKYCPEGYLPHKLDASYRPETCVKRNYQACPVGNPVIPGSGTKLHSETDFTFAGAHPLSYVRHYRSDLNTAKSPGWTSNFHRKLRFIGWNGGMPRTVQSEREDASIDTFTNDPISNTYSTNGANSTQPKNELKPIFDSTGLLIGWRYIVFATDTVEWYSNAGLLLSIIERNGWETRFVYSTSTGLTLTAPLVGLLIEVRNHFGRSIKFHYDAAGKVIKLISPNATEIAYEYNTNNVLSKVTRQDGKTRIYHFEDALHPFLLTGITDELGVRYATYTYDNLGRVVSEKKTGNVGIANFTYYPFDTFLTHLSPTGAQLSQTQIHFDLQAGAYRPSGSSSPSALCDGYAKTITYDAGANKLTELTHDGKHITYTYDAKSRQTSRIERVGSAYGAITYQTTTAYHPTFNLPILITEPNKRTAINYNAKGNVLGYVDYMTTDPTGSLALTAPIVSSQSTGWTYNAKQLPATARYYETTSSGASGVDSTPSTFSFNYNALGDLTKFTQSIAGGALETGTLSSYNANGAFLAGTATTGDKVKHSYTLRGQLATTSLITPAVPAVAATATSPFKPRIPAKTALTTYTYDEIGQRNQVTYPNGDKLVYTYSPAHELKSIKWNGVEQYTPLAGISSNLAALAGYSGVTNPELAYKLGVDATTLDAIDAAPKALTEKTNAAAKAAVDSAVALAKDAVVGREARAILPALAIPALGGGSTVTGWGTAAIGMLGGVGIGAAIDSATGPKTKDTSRICLPGKDPDECQRLYDAYQKAKREASAVGGCGSQTISAADKAFRKPYWERAARTREEHHNKCFDGGDSTHAPYLKEVWRAVANCS